MKSTVENSILLQCAERYGTPLYVYDGDLIRQRYKELFDFIAWPSLRIYYAMKANYNIHILELLHREGARIDAVSIGDVTLAMRAGFRSDDILFTANNVTMDEISEVFRRGILVNIESLSLLEKVGKAFGGGEVCLRFNTDVVAGEHRFVFTGGSESKFGILLEEVAEVKSIAARYGLTVTGLHAHAGSGISDTEKVFQSMRNLLSIATEENFPHLRFIDFGGGFKVPYKPGEKRIDYRSFGAKTVQIFREFCDRYGKSLEMYFEPGKYIVAESGVLLTEVNTLKQNRDHLIAGTNSGFSQLIRPVFYDAYHHILNLSHPEAHMKKYDIYGNICESGDFFAKDREIAEIREGDVLAIMNAGAYCYSMGSVYNLRPMPAEVIVEGGREQLSRRRLSWQEMIETIAAESAVQED
ncbi:MAG: diaminopimelate decarboxylase [Vulcanimicrobiota bacterium]